MGKSFKIDGCIDLTFSVGGTEMKQNFYVVREMNRELDFAHRLAETKWRSNLF